MTQSPTSPSFPGPIVIGGVGGSGTRVVAQMLLDLGVYMGADRNPAHDNLWFTVLFRKPAWFARHSQRGDQAIDGRLRRFAHAMQGRTPSPSDVALFARAALGIALQDGNWKNVRYLRCIATFARAGRVDRAEYTGWGWKEPNAHLYIEPLAALFPDLRYIHTIRHGLDMAYSSNQQQVLRWGPRFGIAPPRDPADMPRASLAFWVTANQAAIEAGRARLGDRFLLLNFDALCRDPEPHIAQLVIFLGRDPASVDLAHLASLPKLPPSVGRYRQHDLSVHDPALVQAVRDLGFEVV